MSKKLLLVIAALSSFGAMADTAGSSHIGQFDKMSFCTYGNGLYSIGAQIQAGKTTLTCTMPDKTENKPSSSYRSDIFKTAHWG